MAAELEQGSHASCCESSASLVTGRCNEGNGGRHHHPPTSSSCSARTQRSTLRRPIYKASVLHTHLLVQLLIASTSLSSILLHSCQPLLAPICTPLPSMVYSAAYNRLAGQRRGNYDAEIDESLFGNTGHRRPQQTTSTRTQPANPTSPTRRPAAASATKATSLISPLQAQRAHLPARTRPLSPPPTTRASTRLSTHPVVVPVQFPTSAALQRKQRILDTKVQDSSVDPFTDDDA